MRPMRGGIRALDGTGVWLGVAVGPLGVGLGTGVAAGDLVGTAVVGAGLDVIPHPARRTATSVVARSRRTRGRDVIRGC
jgi:hypothetical protein